MYSQIKTGEKTTPNTVELVADSAADIEKLPTHYAPGSTCLVVDGSVVYVLSPSKEWK